MTGHPSVEELCLISGALIADCLSLMFGCACLDRPIISHVPDQEACEASRGTHFDLFSGRPGDTPGAVPTTGDELLKLLRTGASRSARTGRAAGGVPGALVPVRRRARGRACGAPAVPGRQRR
ncbi:CDP-glycerol glycerophosphotransferase family protein [Streptomyces sp. NPDC102437]|uniref:CDP-glycerol glycerophosphotransferase family protein n=1 Tax=Streptomyces sp. NPDC102437 TaxID=3366175 RepID=UPI00380684B0